MARAELNSDEADLALAVLPPAENDGVALIWRALHHPLACLLPAAFALALGVAGLLLPQMPGQLNHEPATAARWLLATATESGGLGELWRGLGLFNIRYHPALPFLLTILALALGVRFATAIGSALAFHRWPRQSRLPLAEGGLAVPLVQYQPVQRRRFQVDNVPEPVARTLTEALAALPPRPVHATKVDILHIPYKHRPEPANRVPDATARQSMESPPHAPASHVETRALMQRRPWLAWAPPLRDGGLLIATLSAWTMLVLGWSITTPILPPGEGFQSTVRGISIRYPLESVEPSGSTSQQPVAFIQAESTGATPYAIQPTRQFAGPLLIASRAAAPGLLFSGTSPDVSLRRLGQADGRARLGIVLDAPHYEDTILLPELSAGLRVARPVPEPSTWLIEYYGAGDVQPRARWETDPRTGGTLELPDSALAIHASPAAGLQVKVDAMPGLLFFWVGILLALVGGIAAMWSPFFALIQVAPWYAVTVVTVQSSNIRDPSLRPILTRTFLPPGVGVDTSRE